MTRNNMKNLEEDHFNESLLTLLNGQQDLQSDIPIYDEKNIKLADWLLQIEKVALLTHSQEYELATAKSTNTPYKMLKRLGNNLDWQDIKEKLEEYSPIATEVHAASELHCKTEAR